MCACAGSTHKMPRFDGLANERWHAEIWADSGSAGRVQTRVLMEHWRFDFIKSEVDPCEHSVNATVSKYCK